MMKKIVAFALLVAVLAIGAVAHAERGDIGGIGTNKVGTASPNGSIVPLERGDIGGIGWKK